MSNQHLFLTSSQYEAHTKFWKEKSVMAEDAFRMNGNRIAGSGNAWEEKDCFISGESFDSLKKIAKGSALEVFILLLAGFNALFSKYNRGSFIVIHTPVIGDGESFVPLVFTTDQQRTLKDLIMTVNETVTKSYSYQHYPFSGLDTNIFISYDNLHAPFVPDNSYDLIVRLKYEQEGIALTLQYNSCIFDDWFIGNMLAHYQQILSMLRFFSRNISEVDMLSVQERSLILEHFNDTAIPFPEEDTIISVFESTVLQRRDATAVIAGNKSLTYDQLNIKANRIAGWLISVAGIGPGDTVAVMTDRSEWMLVVILAVMKAGGAYLPVDPAYPQERINYMLQNARAKAMVIHSDYLFQVTDFQVQLLSADLQFDSLAVVEENPGLINVPSDPAYVIYTSGSTGDPKGVAVSHASLLNTQRWRKQFYGFDESYVTLQIASFSFDSSVNDIFSMLLWGGQLLILNGEERSDVIKMKELILQHKVSNFNVVPSLYRMLLEELPAEMESLRVITLAGEKLPEELAKQHFRRYPHVKIINEYGPTENAICSTAWMMDQMDTVDPTIGKPISNTAVYILDDNMQPVPVGVPGEICVSGKGLAIGYVYQPLLTAERFIQHPFLPDERIYLTGDMGQWGPEGHVYFLGRKDQQVKIRGYRIELEEIEVILMQYPGITAAVAIAWETGTVQELAVYFTAKELIDITVLKAYMRSRLPEYMVPAYFIPLDELPLTANGKLDRKALPHPETIEIPQLNYKAARNKEEQLLVNIWEQVLNRQPIGIYDNFFTVGGDSIKAIQIAARMYREGYRLEIRDLFETPLIADLAALLTPVLRIADQGIISGPVPLTPIQYEIFTLQPRKTPQHYNQAVMLAFSEQLSRANVTAVFSFLQLHHDALRVTVDINENGWTLTNRGATHPLDLTEVDMEASAMDIADVCNDIQTGIRFKNGPLMKLGLLQYKDSSRLLIVIHHLVIDTVSWRILLEDMATLLTQQKSGEAFTLPLKTDSFKSWAEALKQYAENEKNLEKFKYWQDLVLTPFHHIKTDFPVSDNLISDAVSTSLLLSEQETNLLLTGVNQAFGTEINDILLTAVSLSLQTLFSDGRVLISMEGHGREPIIPEIDVNRTVGWFTSSYPVMPDVAAQHTLSQQIVAVKESLRSIPDKGIGYGIFRYLTPSGKTAGTMSPDISFNYLGQFEAGTQQGPFRIADDSIGDVQAQDEQRGYLLEISGMISGKQLLLSLTYNPKHYRPETIVAIKDDMKQQLLSVISLCTGIKQRQITPADLMYKQVPINTLKNLLDRYDIQDIYPLAPMQEGFLFHALLDSESDAYFEQVSYELHAELDPLLVEESLRELVRRHDALRMVFIYEGVPQPLQILLRKNDPDFSFLDLSDMEEAARNTSIRSFKEKDIRRSFDLSAGPLMRISLIKKGKDVYEFIWSHHHIIMDGWCTRILVSEYTTIYDSLKQRQLHRLKPAGAYGDYIKWLQRRDREQSRNFWKTWLSGYSELSKLYSAGILPASYQAGNYQFKLDEATTASLNHMAAAANVTFNTVFQTVWGVLLSKYNASADVLFGAVVSGRPSEIAGIEEMVGVFINTIPVRILFEEGDTFISAVKRVQEYALQSDPHQYFPLVEIQSLSELKQQLFDHLIIFENFPLEQAKGNEGPSSVSGVEVFEQTNYNFNVVVSPGNETGILFRYNGNAFLHSFVERIAKHLQYLINTVIVDGTLPVRKLQLEPAADTQQLYKQLNDTYCDYPKNKTVHQLFEEAVKRTPQQVAVISNGQRFTYNEINKKANRIAAWLRQSLNITPGTLIGLMCDRSEWLIAGMLGILKSGAAYLPLDPDFPGARLQYIVVDSGAKLILQQEQYKATAIFKDVEVVAFDNELLYTAEGVDPVAESNGLMYSIYTSGSTGQPKGVDIPHRAVVNLLNSISKSPGIKEGEHFLALTTYSFDISVLELFLPLLNGGTLILASQEQTKDPYLLQELIKNTAPSMMQATPGLWSMLINSGWKGDASLKILCGGEKLVKELGIQLLERCGSLFNMYGPTETTIWSSFKEVKAAEDMDTIGTPLDNTSMYVLDEALHPLPAGIKGGLFIGGDGLANGYRNNTLLTSRKFIDHEGARLYATGDVAMLTPDNEIAFLGRQDDQLKLRGYRIEPGEIENLLRQYTGVNEAVVRMLRIMEEDTLVAYVSGTDDEASLRNHLQVYLPAYMIPSCFVFMAAMPLTPNGKTDRNALPVPDHAEASMRDNYMAPASETEKKLAAIWESLLGVKNISVKDHFFWLGGHSLKAVQLISAVYSQLHVKLPLKKIFLFPVLEQQAQLIIESVPDIYKDIPLAADAADYELSAAQHRIWMADQLEEERTAYLLPAAYWLDGPLDKAAFEQAFDTLIQRHEILRTVFPLINGTPRQQVLPVFSGPFKMAYSEVSKEQAQSLADEEALLPMDLETGPLLRCRLIKTEGRFLFLFTMHHIIADAWSMEVIIEEVLTLYQAFSAGKGNPLAPLPLQYKDYACWQNTALSGPSYNKQPDFWQQQFSGPVPRIELPLDFPRTQNKTTTADSISFFIDEAVKSLLLKIAKQQDTTLYMVVFSAFNILLSAVSGQDDIVTGTPFAGREHPALEKQIGLYMNTLAIRTRINRDERFTDLLKKIKIHLLQAYEYGMFPVDELIPAQRNSLFDTGFTWQSTVGILGEGVSPESGQFSATPAETRNKQVKTDCWLHAWEANDHISFSLLYNTALFRKETMSGMMSDFKELLTIIGNTPDSLIKSLITGTQENHKKRLINMQKSKKDTNLEKFFSISKQQVSTATKSLVSEQLPDHVQPYPLIIRPSVHGLILHEWIRNNKQKVLDELLSKGSILFRGFEINDLNTFRELAGSLQETPMSYIDQSSPRTLVGDKLYTSTDHPADQYINMHNELSYSASWPMQIMFCCLQPATEGGETPVSDSRKVLAALSAETRQKFLEKGICYVRNLVDGFGLSWKEVYQTDDKMQVEQYCRENNISFEWKNDTHLKVSWWRAAIMEHPVSGEAVWFNHGFFFHSSNLDTQVHEAIGSHEELPFDTFYGDGAAIEPEVIEEIRAAYKSTQVALPWQKGDVLLLDNMLTAHGRNPFKGKRAVVVAMNKPYSPNERSHAD